MSKKRREFFPDFKLDTVPLLESSGRSLMQVGTPINVAHGDDGGLTAARGTSLAA